MPCRQRCWRPCRQGSSTSGKPQRREYVPNRTETSGLAALAGEARLHPRFEYPFYPAYLERYRQSPSSGCLFEDFDCLELAKTVEMIGVPDKRLEIYNSLR